METQSTTSSADQVAGWSPLTARQRRVLGVLMEKSKTTPDAYPMTFAGLTTGCNQKTNRAPITNLTTEQVEQTTDELRGLGAVTLVQGNGRVDKIRHYAYQWLGLSKTEAAIMTELLLRGEQTIGELRTRASRMEPIADLSTLQSLIEALVSRNLMVQLTPSGRGQLVSHNLYPEWELVQLQKKISEGGYELQDSDDDSSQPELSSEVSRMQKEPMRNSATVSQSAARPTESVKDAIQDSLMPMILELKDQIARLSARVDYLERELGVENTSAI